MIEALSNLDHHLFYFINHTLTNPFFDWLMPLLRNKWFWVPLYLFLVLFLVKNYRTKGAVIIMYLLITFALTDMISAGLIKPIVNRLRPCNDILLKATIHQVVGCGVGFSFPSSHAANHFGIAVFLITVFYHKWKLIMPLAIMWAASICFAQVYVGVHYPFDVTAGGLLGALIGYITGTIFQTVQKDKQWKPGN